MQRAEEPPRPHPRAFVDKSKGESLFTARHYTRRGRTERIPRNPVALS